MIKFEFVDDTIKNKKDNSKISNLINLISSEHLIIMRQRLKNYHTIIYIRGEKYREMNRYTEEMKRC